MASLDSGCWSNRAPLLTLPPKVRPFLNALLSAALLAAAPGCNPAVSTDQSTATPAAASRPSATPLSPDQDGSPAAAPASPQPVRPIRALTPGALVPGVTAEQVCTPAYARRVRHVLPEQYQLVYGSYGIPYPQPPGTYELDHLIPLELGGDNSNGNLWPQPAMPVPGFHQKDELENVLHDQVCAGRLALADAQRGIAADWVALYLRYLGS